MNSSVPGPTSCGSAPAAPDVLRRVLRRARTDAQIVRLVRNWPQVLVAKFRRRRWPILRLRNGLILSAPSSLDMEFVFNEVWLEQQYTPPGYTLEAGQTVIDIGANVGVFALFAATRGKDVRVIAFEPFAENVRWLQRNKARSRTKVKVQLYQEAVTARREVRTLHVAPQQWGAHRLSAESTASESGAAGPPPSGFEAVVVNCVGLDEIMERDNITCCDLLKIDCEGSEYEILLGASPQSLNRIRRIVGEFHQGENIEGSGESLCAWLRDEGFRIDHFSYFSPAAGSFAATNTRPLM